MAGDWIKMRMDLPEDPAVFKLAGITGMDRFAVVGRLYAFWSWADHHAVDGRVDGATSQVVDAVTQLVGFADALVNVRWLEIGDGFISIPKHERHNGTSAKERALKNQRQERWRRGKAGVDVRIDANTSTKASTREEKRRSKPPISPAGFSQFWIAYPRKVARSSAIKAFAKLNPDGVLLASMLVALDRQTRSTQWMRDSGAFIPHPATWLNGRRWEDEAAVAITRPFPA